MKTYRNSKGGLQLIIETGFNKEDFGFGFNVTYLDGMKVDDFVIEGFWCIQIELLVISFTFNITDKKSKQNYQKSGSGHFL